MRHISKRYNGNSNLLLTARIVTACVLTVFFFCSMVPVSANARNADTDARIISSIELADFLSGMDLTLDEYLILMDGYEDSGIYPHYLQENEARYNAYQTRNPFLSESAVIALVNVNADFEFFKGISPVPDPDCIRLLVNKHHQLPITHVPDDLVRISGSSYQLREEAATHFTLMREELLDVLGLRLHIVSAYRAGVRQDRMHRNSTMRYGLEFTDRELARGGHSEHQTGLSIDFLQRGHGGRLENARFHESEQFAWLLDNAHRYGFILRYPNGYENITGYIFESWHWRYVGQDIATAMYERSIIIYEEFVGKYLAPDVLFNVKWLILTERAQQIAAQRAAEAELLRIEQELRLAQEQAAIEEQLAALAAEKAAGRQAMIQAQLRLFELPRQQVHTDDHTDGVFFIAALILSSCLIVVICLLAADVKIFHRKEGKHA